MYNLCIYTNIKTFIIFIHLAIVLAEGAVKHSIATKGRTCILGTFIETPLVWGVHVGCCSEDGIANMDELNSRLLRREVRAKSQKKKINCHVQYNINIILSIIRIFENPKNTFS